MFRTLLCLLCLALLTAADAQRALRPFAPAPELGAGEIRFARVSPEVDLPRAGGAFELALPSPSGGEVVGLLEEAPVLPAELQARFPDIRTYRGVTAEGHGVAVTMSGADLRAYVNAPGGSWGIEPVGDGLVRVGSTASLTAEAAAQPLACGYAPDGDEAAALDLAHAAVERRSGGRVQVEKRVYVMALACTAEYAQSKGGTVSSVMATFAESLNILNTIILRETAISFELHPNNDTLIFLDRTRDPYTQPTVGSSLLGENPPAINARIPIDEYDIGHVFTTGCSDVGGVVSGRVCNDAGKARGVTCHYTSLQRIVEEVMAHEVAHQFAVAHSWNNCPGADQQRSGGAAYEPGSGSTIMSYQGSCPGNNISVLTNDPYYHVHSLQQFADFAVAGAGATCADVVAVDNQLPEIDWPYADGFAIPAQTPFRLAASATDPDGDRVLYNWEQYDLGPATVLCNQLGDSPLFRSVPPAGDGNVRFFPDLADVAGGRDNCEEQLPEGGRTLRFRMTARDRNPVGGGAVWEQVDFAVADGTGPFVVTSQATPAVTYVTGGFVPVTWDVAGTNAVPIDCRAVDIMLSVDGGRTFEYALAEGTDNDGEEGVTLPAGIESTRARIMVRAADNIFYALSASDFTIVTPTEPGFTFAPGASTRFVCGTGGVEEVDFFTASLLDYDDSLSVRIVSDELPAEVTARLADSVIAPGESTTLALDLSGFARTDSIAITVEASGPSVDTVQRTVLFDVVATDFTDLALAGPLDGADGVGILPTFTYQPSVAAEAHVIQVSQSPDFGIGSLEIINPDPAGDQLAVNLEVNTLYFWRVVPANRCEEYYEGPVYLFHTFASDCESFTLEESLIIPPSVRETVTAPIEVTATGVVNDLNVPNIRVRYSEINDVRVNLRAPDGTTSRLISRRCGGTSQLDVGFDDEAASAFDCAIANSGGVMRPQNPLDTFAGLQVGGTWALEVEVVDPSTTGGEFESFEIEFCADIVSLAPALSVSEVEVPTGGLQYLSDAYLDGTDEDNSAADLRYYLVALPERGIVVRNGDTLGLGDYWLQAEGNSGQVAYVHQGAIDERDTMTVALTDHAGNVLEPAAVPINMEAGFETGVAEALPEVALSLAPNPTAATSVVRWAEPSAGGRLQLFDARGRVVLEEAVAPGQAELRLEVAGLSAGVYSVAYRGAEGVGVMRLVVR